jgi:alkylhydroperoxidase family enzyme
LAQVNNLDGWRLEQFERFPSNLTRALLLMDQRTAGQLPAMANALRASSLDPLLREAVILRVAALSNSAYERFQHLGPALSSGWTERQIGHIEMGEWDSLPKGFKEILALVDELAAGATVDDALLAQVRSFLSDSDLVTVIVLIGHYMTVARILSVLGVELDATPDQWRSEH